MTAPYVTSAEFKKTLTLTGTSYADDDIDRALASAERGIDRACGRVFYTVDETRYYSPTDPFVLEIDDVHAITSLQTDPAGDGTWPYTWELHTDYEVEPLNAELRGRPWTTIRRRLRANYVLPIWYERSVKIVGSFGWPEVPDEVIQATMILARRLLERARGEATFGVVGLGSIDNVAAARIARTDPDVTGLISPYMRDDLLVG